MSSYGFSNEEFGLTVSMEGCATCSGPAEFDMVTAPGFRAAFSDIFTHPEVTEVIVNLGRTSFLDASGITALSESREHARKAGKQFSVRDVQRMPHRVLKITGMLEFLNVQYE
jgi:anti-anti-sigma factor